jgi:hypothetical protein
MAKRNLIVIEQRNNEFDRIAKVRFSSIYFYALRGWYHFPDTCQDLFLAERVISQVLKTSESLLSQSYACLITVM